MWSKTSEFVNETIIYQSINLILTYKKKIVKCLINKNSTNGLFRSQKLFSFTKRLFCYEIFIKINKKIPYIQNILTFVE